MNECQVIKEVLCAEEKEESDQDSSISDDTPAEEHFIENITAFFEITEFHTHLPQYSEDFYSLIIIHYSRMLSLNKATYKEEFVTNQLFEAQINPKLLSILKQELIYVLYTYRNAFASDKEPLGSIRVHEVDFTIDIDRPYHPVLRRPAYPANQRDREALEKHIQELTQLGVLRKVGHNEEAEMKNPVIIPWNNDKSRMVGDFRAMNTYTAPDRYEILRIQEALTQLSKSKYITSMDALKGFHKNVLMPKAKNLLRIITHCCLYEYLRVPFGIKNVPSHHQRRMNTIFLTELSKGWLIIYIDDIIICSDSWSLHLEKFAGTIFGLKQERTKAYEKIREALTEALLILIPDWDIPFQFYIYEFGDGLGEDLNTAQIVSENPTKTLVCYVSRKIKPTEARYGASRMEGLFFVWALEKLHYYLDGSFFEVKDDCNSIRSLLNMKTPNRDIFRWQIVIQEYRGNIIIVHKAGNLHKNSDELSRWELANPPDNPACVPLEE
ncbi:hypothetical protein O181_094347 [Austropuccinia psidii MF-1]|uniref:Reverse transcriptase RNase H-like domain-containing protein n=1 Tax=Austropuccinia psidii MF-1 TaxID=1389203 RepID=A0A9Q3PBF4_9BASI|nr:hypothetical protein [Austropuccinia psidii MF-1]